MSVWKEGSTVHYIIYTCDNKQTSGSSFVLQKRYLHSANPDRIETFEARRKVGYEPAERSRLDK